MLRFITYALLLPFSYMWEQAYKLRRFLYKYKFLKSYTFAVPIISVGNVTFGGTGKTPFSIWLADYLDNLDKKVMVLTRGYKGKLESTRGIIPSGTIMGFNPKEFGDEALLLGRNLRGAAIVVGKNRARNLSYYFEQERPDVVILDDGHQHLKINRNFNVVLFDCMLNLKKYKTAPLGYLREGMTALADADAIVLGRANQIESAEKEKLINLIHDYIRPNTIITEIGYHPVGFYSMQYQLMYNMDEVKKLKVLALSAIASPDSFHNMLVDAGIDVVEYITFPDHHFYSVDEIQKILERARTQNCIIVTTEKDIVKIKRLSDDDLIMFMKIDIFFLEGETAFKTLLTRRLGW